MVEIWHGESGSLTGGTGVLGGGTFQGAKHAQAGAAWRQMPHVELGVETLPISVDLGGTFNEGETPSIDALVQPAVGPQETPVTSRALRQLPSYKSPGAGRGLPATGGTWSATQGRTLAGAGDH